MPMGLTEESLGQGQCVSTKEDPKTGAHRLINVINLCTPVAVSPQGRPFNHLFSGVVA